MAQCLHVGQNVAAIGVETFQHCRNNFAFLKMGFLHALVGIRVFSFALFFSGLSALDGSPIRGEQIICFF